MSAKRSSVLVDPTDNHLIADYVFACNLESQDYSGNDAAASWDATRVRALIGGTPQLSSELYYCPDQGWILLGFPLQEDLQVVRLELTLDAELQPLPGEPLEGASLDAFRELLDTALEILHAHPDRSEIQSWFYKRACPRLHEELAHRGFELLTHEASGYLTLPCPATVDSLGLGIRIVEDLEADNATLTAIAALFQLASTQIPTGGFTAEEEQWDLPRIDDLRSRCRETDSRIITAVGFCGENPVAVSSLSIQLSGIPGVAGQGDTVVDPAYRRRGFGRAIKQALYRHAHDNHGIRRVYTTCDTSNTAILGLNDSLGFHEISQTAGYRLLR